MKPKRSKIWQISSEEFKSIVTSHNTYTEILAAFSIRNHGSNYQTLNARIEYEKLDISHIIAAREIAKRTSLKANTRVTAEEVLVENSPFAENTLRRVVLRENIIPYVCAKCGCGAEWLGEPLTLQLDHINGVGNDHRKENLRFLCPNCHSQTKTYSRGTVKVRPGNGQCLECNTDISTASMSGLCQSCASRKSSNRTITRPPKEELIDIITRLGYAGTGRHYDVSEKTIKKWKKYYATVT